MKAINAYYRKNKTIDGCLDASEEILTKIHASMGWSWRPEPKPFEGWALSNNNANIKRVRERIAELEKRATIAAPAGWEFDGGRVAMNMDENRVQILFDEKPDETMRTHLKRNGFRWAPSQGAWQRQLNSNGIYAAKAVTGVRR